MSARAYFSRSWRWLCLSAFLVAQGFGLFVGCASGVPQSEAQNAAIVAGCEVSESLVDGGEAGAADEARDLASIKTGCTTALRVWDHSK